MLAVIVASVIATAPATTVVDRELKAELTRDVGARPSDPAQPARPASPSEPRPAPASHAPAPAKTERHVLHGTGSFVVVSGSVDEGTASSGSHTSVVPPSAKPKP